MLSIVVHTAAWSCLALCLQIVRIMLLANPRHDRDLLRESHYKVRRPALLISLRKYAAKHSSLDAASHAPPADVSGHGEVTNDHSFLFPSPTQIDALDLLAELYGASPVAWRRVIQYI